MWREEEEEKEQEEEEEEAADRTRKWGQKEPNEIPHTSDVVVAKK